MKKQMALTVLLGILLTQAETVKGADSKPGNGSGEPGTTAVTSVESVELKWDMKSNGEGFAVYRSTFEEGPYEELDITEKSEYSDRSAVPGVIYWYRIIPLNEESPLEPGPAVSGYRKNLPVKGAGLRRILKRKVRDLPVIRDREKRALDAKFNNFLKKFYMNNVKLSIIIAAGEGYLKRGELILLKDFDRYIIDDSPNISYFIKEGRYRVKYYSKKFSSLIRGSRLLDPGKERLTKRLLENLLVYCIDAGDTEITGEDGVKVVVKSYEAIGVSTEYYRDYHNWRFRTVMTASSNKKIKKMMRDAQRRRRR